MHVPTSLKSNGGGCRGANYKHYYDCYNKCFTISSPKLRDTKEPPFRHFAIVLYYDFITIM